MKQLLFTLLLITSTTLIAANPYRIVVLPFYVEQGNDIRDPILNNRDYRRVRGLINNHLVRSGFDVVNASAADISQQDYDTLAQKFQADSQTSIVDLNRRYATDAVYIIWLEANVIHGRGQDSGLCKIKLNVDGEGYASDNSSLGATMAEQVMVGGGDCRDALRNAEKSVANIVGEFIAGTSTQPNPSITSHNLGDDMTLRPAGKSLLERQLDNKEALITIRLNGITRYETIEVMGKVLNTVNGVLYAKRLMSNFTPNNAQASYEVWRLSYDSDLTDLFRIQANIMNMITDIIYSNGKLTLKGVPYRYTAGQVSLLKGIRPGRTSSKEIQFIFDIGRKSRFGFE